MKVTRFTFESEFESANGYKYKSSLGKPYSAFLESQGWKLDDSNKKAIKYLRYILNIDDASKEPEHNQDYLETLYAAR